MVILTDSKSVTDDYTEDRIAALRSVNHLEALLLRKNASRLDVKYVHLEIERMIHSVIDFGFFSLDDRIVDQPLILGQRLSKCLATTGTIVTFRNLTTHRLGVIRTIRGVGDGDIRRIEAALASKGAEFNKQFEPSELHSHYLRIIPLGFTGGGEGYAYVYRGQHKLIAMEWVWKWANLSFAFPPFAQNDDDLQTLGQLLLLSRPALVAKIYDWFQSSYRGFNEITDLKLANEVADKLKVYVDGTKLPWWHFNDDVEFATSILAPTTRDVLISHDLHKISDLRRFIASGKRLTEVDPALDKQSEAWLIEMLENFGAKDIASSMKSHYSGGDGDLSVN